MRVERRITKGKSKKLSYLMKYNGNILFQMKILPYQQQLDLKSLVLNFQMCQAKNNGSK